MEKQVCGRCGGSGKYSFNLIRGTVCFGCNGSGFQMVDPKKVAARKAAAAKRDANQQANRARVMAMSNEVIAEMNALYGPFNVETELGIDQLNKAVATARNKSLWAIRDERLREAA